jgi:hypothetical protein
MAAGAFGAIDILKVVAITAFAGGTSFLGVYISKHIKFAEQHVLTVSRLGTTPFLNIGAIVSSCCLAPKYVHISSSFSQSAVTMPK